VLWDASVLESGDTTGEDWADTPDEIVLPAGIKIVVFATG
jgi:hypothetical protein